MRLVRINRDPSPRQLAVFSAAWVLFFSIVGGMTFANSGAVAIGLLVVALLVPTVGLVVPGFMRIIYLGASYLTFPIGFVLLYVIMAAVYFLLFSPMGMLMRLFGYDPMRRRFDPKADTYWTPRRGEDNIKSYFKQF